MLSDALTVRLVALLADVTGAPAASLGPASSPGNTPGWDSLASLGFIAAVEEDFGVSILTAEAMQVKGLSDMVGLLERKGVKAAG